MHTIRFYSTSAEYGEFSNFAGFSIKLAGKRWPTVEHYFQAQKFTGTPREHEIRRAKTPAIAKRMGRARSPRIRRDWEAVRNSVMYAAVRAKFTQHEQLRELLLGTGDARLIEHTAQDSYWGDGGDGSGENKLGQTLMRVRDELKQSANKHEDCDAKRRK